MNSDKKLIRVDKNGTKHYESYICRKCGGTGHLDYFSYNDNGVCYACNGTGRKLETWTERTPEYEALLEKRRIARLPKKAEKSRKKYREQNGFDENGFTWIVLGNSYTIKETLKKDGGFFSPLFGWHFNHEYENSLKFHISHFFSECLENEGYIFSEDFNEKDFHDLIRSKGINVRPSSSSHVGELKKRQTFRVTLEAVFTFYNQWGETIIYKFKDENDNILVWKTGNVIYGPANENGKYSIRIASPKTTFMENHDTYEFGFVNLTGTVKEHSEYRGEKQTVLSRCKILN
jgi:hypothetical protein